MAIKVFQGLIDVGRGDVINAPQSKPTPSTAIQPNPQVLQQQLSNVAHQAHNITETLKSSDAVLTTLRASKGTNESNAIRDPDRAKKVAEEVSERIVEREGESREAHSSLNASGARSHFSS